MLSPTMSESSGGDLRPPAGQGGVPSDIGPQAENSPSVNGVSPNDVPPENGPIAIERNLPAMNGLGAHDVPPETGSDPEGLRPVNGSCDDDAPAASGASGGNPPPALRSDWRDARGRFIKGNPGGPGNPHVRRTARLRSAILESISDDDFRTVVARLVKLAKGGGDLRWVRELFDRTVGKSTTAGADADDGAADNAG